MVISKRLFWKLKLSPKTPVIYSPVPWQLLYFFSLPVALRWVLNELTWMRKLYVDQLETIIAIAFLLVRFKDGVYCSYILCARQNLYAIWEKCLDSKITTIPWFTYLEYWKSAAQSIDNELEKSHNMEITVFLNIFEDYLNITSSHLLFALFCACSLFPLVSGNNEHARASFRRPSFYFWAPPEVNKREKSGRGTGLHYLQQKSDEKFI